MMAQPGLAGGGGDPDLELLGSPHPAVALAACCRLAYRRGLVAGTGGNASARWGAGFLCTPTGAGLGGLSAHELVACDARGQPLDAGGGRPSSEWPLHARLYAAFPEARAVLHTHSPFATLLACRGVGPQLPTPELAHVLRRVPCVPFAHPGTEALAEAAAEAMLPDAVAALLARHGAVVWARDCREAFQRAELLEEACALTFRLRLWDGAERAPAGGR